MTSPLRRLLPVLIGLALASAVGWGAGLLVLRRIPHIGPWGPYVYIPPTPCSHLTQRLAIDSAVSAMRDAGFDPARLEMFEIADLDHPSYGPPQYLVRGANPQTGEISFAQMHGKICTEYQVEMELKNGVVEMSVEKGLTGPR